MPVVPQATPNPNALKFIVGVDVGGPKTFVSAGVASGEVEDPAARALLEIDGVTSVFMTAEFVTLSKTPDVDWARHHTYCAADPVRSIRRARGVADKPSVRRGATRRCWSWRRGRERFAFLMQREALPVALQLMQPAGLPSGPARRAQSGKEHTSGETIANPRAEPLCPGPELRHGPN